MLLYLKQNTVNDVVLTLREKSLLWTYSAITPFYLFEFTSPTTNSSLRFVADNISSLSAQDSYDEFHIITTASTYTNLSAGTISLNPAIFWEYNVYEQTNQYNFDTTQTVSCVEKGKVFYSAATQDFGYIKMTGNTSHITFNTY